MYVPGGGNVPKNEVPGYLPATYRMTQGGLKTQVTGDLWKRLSSLRSFGYRLFYVRVTDPAVVPPASSSESLTGSRTSWASRTDLG